MQLFKLCYEAPVESKLAGGGSEINMQPFETTFREADQRAAEASATAYLRRYDLKRGKNVYIANIVKCRPPGNRNPEAAEVAQCEPYLHRQIALIKPKLIVALGKVAAVNLLKRDAAVASMRGKLHEYRGIPLIVTYHPAYLLRSLPEKAKAWVDLRFAVDTMQTLQSRNATPI